MNPRIVLCRNCGEDISHRVKPGPGRPPEYCEEPDTFTATVPVARHGVDTGRRLERAYRLGTTQCQWTREKKRRAASDHRKIKENPERFGVPMGLPKRGGKPFVPDAGSGPQPLRAAGVVHAAIAGFSGIDTVLEMEPRVVERFTTSRPWPRDRKQSTASDRTLRRLERVRRPQAEYSIIDLPAQEAVVDDLPRVRRLLDARADECLNGGRVEGVVTRCPTSCHGTGLLRKPAPFEDRTCSYCGGTGKVTELAEQRRKARRALSVPTWTPYEPLTDHASEFEWESLGIVGDLTPSMGSRLEAPSLELGPGQAAPSRRPRIVAPVIAAKRLTRKLADRAPGAEVIGGFDAEPDAELREAA